MKIEQQAPNISIATLKKLADGHDNVTININMTAIQGKEEGAEPPVIDVPSHAVDALTEDAFFKMLWDMPEPRLRSLVEYTINLAQRKHGASSLAAAWLGVSYRTVRERQKKVKEIERG